MDSPIHISNDTGYDSIFGNKNNTAHREKLEIHRFPPCETIPGATNVNRDHQNSFSWNILRGDEYIAYISNASVIIYQGIHIQQILSYPYYDDSYKGIIPSTLRKERLKLVSFCNERLIIVAESFVYIFTFTQSLSDDLGAKTTSVGSSYWELEVILEIDFPVECLHANKFGDRFILGGKFCQMFRYKHFSESNKYWRSVWKEEMPNPIRAISISPDDRLFATLSDPQVPLAKIWYKSFSTMRNNQNMEHYSFLYLKHKKPIISMEWRSKEIIDLDFPNVLMTYSADGVQRFWVETSLNEELHFHISTSNFKPDVHATHFLCTPHELSPNEVIMAHAASSRIDTGDAGHQDILPITDVDKGVYYEPSSKLNSESQTWVITIFKDGSVEIDLIYGLADQPRRTPSSSVWIRMFDIFPTLDLEKEHSDILIFYTCNDTFRSNVANGTPSLLTIYSLSEKGRISNYTLPISHDPNNHSLHLNAFITGHMTTISKLLAHPVLPLAASYDKDSQTLLFWHFRGSAFFNPPHILTHILEVNDILISDFTWLPNQSALFISTPQGIEILNIVSKRPGMYNSLLCRSDLLQQMDSDRHIIFPPIPVFYSANRYDDIVDGSEDFSMCSYTKILSFTADSECPEFSPIDEEPISAGVTFLVALSKDKDELGIWKIDIDKGSFQKQLTAPFRTTRVLQRFFNEEITCMDCRIVTPFVVDAEGWESEFKACFVFGTEDGRVLCFSSQRNAISAPKFGLRKSSSSSFVQTLDFKASNEPISFVKCSEQLAKIATATRSGNHVTIWDTETNTTATKEQKIQLPASSSVSQLSWFSFGTGDRSLLIGTTECIHCYSQSRSDLCSSRDLWEEVAILERRHTIQPCTSISITKEKTILCSFGKNIHVYTKWLQMEKRNGTGDEYYISKIRNKNRRLPDYHPKLLEDLLMTGNLDMVRDIFIHLAHNLMKCEYTEVYIPPLPINFFKMTTKKEEKPIQRRVTLLDRYKFKSLEPDSDDEVSDISRNGETANLEEKAETKEISYVRKETDLSFQDAYTYLRGRLAKTKLLELSGVDQMNLIAILDTFHKVQIKPEALDDPAIRYYVAFHNALYLEKSSKYFSISSAHIAWVMQSETQDALVKMLSLQNSGKLDWTYVKKLGIPLWMNNISQLRDIAQQMARDRFSKETSGRDPSVCALLYLVLGKKSTLIKLYKTIGEEKIAKFVARDFDPDAAPDSQAKINCTLAAKNAYKLIGQHKYEYAAAFFFLAGGIRDMIDILVKRVDIVMAYFIMRIYKGDHDPETISFVKTVFIPFVSKNWNDPWLQNIAYWRMREYEKSLEVLCTTRCDTAIEKFDGSLYSYCQFVSKKPQLMDTYIFEKSKSKVLLNVCYYFLRTGALVLALENLKQLNLIDDNTLKPISNHSRYQDPSMEIMTGMLDMSSFGMGGFAMQSNEASFSPSYSSKLQDKQNSQNITESKDHKKLTQQLSFIGALVYMTQELDDLFKKPNPSPVSDWKEFQDRIQEETIYLYDSFNVNKKLIYRKMKEYCRLNGHLVSRCVISPNEDIKSIIQGVTYPAVALLSKMQYTTLSKDHVQLTNNFTNEFIFCYERCLAIGEVIPVSQRADWGVCLYSLMFVSWWSAGDFKALHLLLDLPFSMNNNDRSPQSFYKTIIFQLPEFYHKFHEQLQKEKEAEEMDEQLNSMESELGTKTRKSYYGISKNKVASASNQGIKSEHDAQIDQLKRDFQDIMFEAVLLTSYVDNTKFTLQQAYASESTEKPLFSITARTILSSVTLWYSCILDKLQYKQLELYAARKQLSRRSFRDVASLSFTSSNSLLSNLVKTLVFSARQTNKRKSTQMSRNISSNDFSSIIHAIPDLQQEEGFNTRNQINELLDDADIREAKFGLKKEILWDYLVSKTFPESTWNVSIDSNVDTLPTDQTSSIVFSAPIEIAKCKEPIKAFCINKSQPQYLTFATTKLIREINIEHSIKYRKRNATKQKLLDEEMPTWNESIHRFDNKETENDHSRVLMSRRSVETVSHFLDFVDEYPSNQSSPKSALPEFSAQGMGTVVHSHKPLWKKVAKKIKRAHRTRAPTFSGHSESHIQSFRSSKRLSESIDHRVSVNVLISHPSLPFYLSGGLDGSIYLWQFQQEHPIRVYKPAGGPSIINIKFGVFGFKFGALNEKGEIHLWRFDSSKDSIQEFDRLRCHTDKTTDFTFLNSGSMIATVGSSNGFKELSIWDVLLPEHESIIVKEVFEEEPSCLAYASHFDYIIIGCKKGEILIYSVGTQRIVKKFTLENKILENITLDGAEDFFVVGCSDGDLLIFDLNILSQVSSFKSNHQRRGIRFLGDSAAGVSKSEVIDYYLYSCGADGRILRRFFVV